MLTEDQTISMVFIHKFLVHLHAKIKLHTPLCESADYEYNLLNNLCK